MTAGLTSRSRRLLSAAIAIIIGTAFLATSLIVLSTAQRGLEDTVAAGLRDADLVVTGSEGVWLTPEDFDTAAGLDGVASAAGETMVSPQLGQEYFPGTSVPSSGATLLQGRLPEGDGEIAVNPDAVDEGLAVGDTLELTPMPGAATEPPPPVRTTVVGVIDRSGSSVIGGGGGNRA